MAKMICFYQKVSNPTTVDPPKCNIAEERDKNIKTATMNILKDLKEDMNNALKEVCENTELKEIVKTIQDMKVEFN